MTCEERRDQWERRARAFMRGRFQGAMDMIREQAINIQNERAVLDLTIEQLEETIRQQAETIHVLETLLNDRGEQREE